ncbi:hypothetical protein DRW41_21845 [Neobacillus piezotolerans]|uniref:DUF3131 domain-containing protein n=1 Tax=Neobacillus piezotolerans TaxID=2259171 RepID=A0A3D8GK78_9BACI|nr:hypothetical protein [Neobacillus piezotolerans]RDU34741.1 hypothetical protein DRW41_21845 [Neobacillus piezotolerans]
MKKAWGLLVIIMLLAGCTNVGIGKERPNAEKKPYENSDYISELWKVTVKDYLKDDLWLERDIYDSGHFLMVPLHYAYQNEDPKLMRDFEKHFGNFTKSGIETLDINEDGNRLATLQYYYLLSRYIVLAESSNSPVINESNVDYLANFLLSEIKNIWETPAWQWGRKPFKNGMEERLLWKIENTEVKPSYYRAIIDEELFTMAIAADLKQYFKNEPTLEEISSVTYRVFKNESHFDAEGRWLFQVGVWTDHPDYVFAGYEDKNKVSEEKKKVMDIVQDSSHSHRFPLWINSFAQSFGNQTNEKLFFEKVLSGLEKQFFDKVLVPPTNETPYYRLTNYMNGHNGMFRWKYNTTGNDGYGPYELSGTFTIGWWTFLGSERIKSVYADLADQFPLSQEAVNLYVGPNTTRERNPHIADPSSYYNGYKKLLSLLASGIE